MHGRVTGDYQLSIMDNLHTMTEQEAEAGKMERIGVFCASSSQMDQSYYDAARELGHWLGSHGKTLVYGGSRCGMMEVLAQAVKESGGRVFGVVPQKVLKRGMVSDQIDITFYADGLSDRKDWLIGESDIMVVLPGSVGTLDEAFYRHGFAHFWRASETYRLLQHQWFLG